MNYIPENIKKFRTALNLTQEQLGERVGVTTQAVSKWERGESLPDTALIVPIAAILGVTPNDILGYDKVEIEAEIKRRLDERNRLSSLGKTVEAFAVIKKAHDDFPNDYKIMTRYVDSLGYEPRPEFLDNHDSWKVNRDEIIRLANRVINESGDPDLRFECALSLSACYAVNGNIKQAEEVCKQFPLSNIYTRSSALAFMVYENGDPRQTALLRELYYESVYDTMWQINHRFGDTDLTENERFAVLQIPLTIADAVFPDADWGFASAQLADHSCRIAKRLIWRGDIAAALPYARRCMEFSRYYDAKREAGEDVVLTSPVVRGHVWKVNNVSVGGNYDGTPIGNTVKMNITAIEQTKTTDPAILALLDEYRAFAKYL